MPIRKGLIFDNPEGSFVRQSGRVLFLPIRRGPIFANPEGSQIFQSEGVLLMSIRRGIVLPRLKKTTEKIVVKGFRLLGDSLGTCLL